MKKKDSISLIPLERIEGAILEIRGERVMLDTDPAGIYGVTTRRLKEQVRRNRDRFSTPRIRQVCRTHSPSTAR
jgi:hypothetical protein